MHSATAGVGKSSLLAEICKSTKIEFVRFITSLNLLKMQGSETGRAQLVEQAFEDANKVGEALIVLDSLEQLV